MNRKLAASMEEAPLCIDLSGFGCGHEDSGGHFDGCAPKSFRFASPFVHDSNIHIRRRHVGIIRQTC